jgi:hypothetical protein
MFRGLILYLALRRLRGRTVGVSTRSQSLLALRGASFGPAGVRGLAIDGDEIFAPWTRVRFLQWGPVTDGIVARRLEAVEAADSEEDDDDTPLDAILRSVARRGTGPEGTPPALSREEIAAILAEDDDGRAPGHG